MNRPVLWITGLLLLSLAACTDESTRASRGTFASRLPAEQVFEATKTALKLVGFSVSPDSQQDENSMMVTGQKNAMATWAGPAPVYINVTVTPLQQGAEISVQVIPPPRAYGSSGLPLHDYQYALSLVIPDLTVKSVEVPHRLLH